MHHRSLAATPGGSHLPWQVGPNGCTEPLTQQRWKWCLTDIIQHKSYEIAILIHFIKKKRHLFWSWQLIIFFLGGKKTLFLIVCLMGIFTMSRFHAFRSLGPNWAETEPHLQVSTRAGSATDGSEIPNNHLGCIWNHVNNGIFTISTGYHICWQVVYPIIYRYLQYE